ncbi:MAG: hypothetical protein ACI8S6_002517, partial [Myxococcota bacterium]
HTISPERIRAGERHEGSFVQTLSMSLDEHREATP